jgi:6-pyruvoyltetrahydropterin/6-carboxytetrahydropterin synthase
MKRFRITRKIEIDAAHRVPDHTSKCQNLHGHRYVIEATCTGDLVDSGPESGMVMDFGFLKDALIMCVDKFYDHAMIAWEGDPLLKGIKAVSGKIMILPVIPTAENLAKIWFEAVEIQIRLHGGGGAVLESITVHETPNCWATYPA